MEKKIKYSRQAANSQSMGFGIKLLLDQTILLHLRSCIDRPLNLPQYPVSNNYFSIPEENI
jgi:hypothetical protein